MDMAQSEIPESVLQIFGDPERISLEKKAWISVVWEAGKRHLRQVTTLEDVQLLGELSKREKDYLWYEAFKDSWVEVLTHYFNGLNLESWEFHVNQEIPYEDRLDILRRLQHEGKVPSFELVLLKCYAYLPERAYDALHPILISDPKLEKQIRQKLLDKGQLVKIGGGKYARPEDVQK
jgi:hypothetical protein